MIFKKFGFAAAVCLVASACAPTAMPNFYNGYYYMAGDNNCKRMYSLSSTRIMCIDENGRETGYRDAMTDQQLQMYMHNQQIQQQMYNNQNQNNNMGPTWCNQIGNLTHCF